MSEHAAKQVNYHANYSDTDDYADNDFGYWEQAVKYR